MKTKKKIPFSKMTGKQFLKLSIKEQNAIVDKIMDTTLYSTTISLKKGKVKRVVIKKA